MKAWVMAIHERAAEVRGAAPASITPALGAAGTNSKTGAKGSEAGKSQPQQAQQAQAPAAAGASTGGGLSKRAQLMLELVIDIKNNKWVNGVLCTGSTGTPSTPWST
jgi:hypothetical protein